jgi:Type II CAAX prenyl endopeptidase Rce1-like
MKRLMLYGMQQQPFLASIALFAAALAKLVLPSSSDVTASKPTAERRRRNTILALLLAYGIPSLLLWLIGQPRAIFTAILWRPLTTFLSQWPTLLTATSSTTSPIIDSLIAGGPLGKGCGKLMEVIAAAILWKVFRGSLPASVVATFDISSWYQESASAWVMLAAVTGILSIAVNGVLFLWSYYTKSNGNHQGLHQLVQPTVGRKLKAAEHVQLAALAVINAVCEECTSRGFWRREFELTAHLSSTRSNIAQAVIFGAWHYHGIPSGWTGVALTTVYGWILGSCYLANDWNTPSTTTTSTGLLMPVVTHSIADYYIFTVLARKQQQAKTF